jgi:hypothetical protein
MHAAPHTAPSWVQLCAEVRRWPAEQFEDEFKPYVLHALERWPDALRAMPHDWVGHLFEGRGQGWHITSMMRSLRLEPQQPRSADVEAWQDAHVTPRLARLCAHDWTSLRSLDIAYPLSPAHWRALSACQWFKQLRHLRLGIFSWSPALLEAVWLEEPPLHLESLTLRMARSGRTIGSGMGLHRWPALRALSIDAGSTSAAFWDDVSDAFPALRSLTLEDTMLWPESFAALAHVEWLDGLESLAITHHPRRHPPQGEEYVPMDWSYEDYDPAQMDLLDTDNGVADYASDACRVLLHSPRLTRLRALTLKGQLTGPVVDAVAQSPSLGGLERICWDHTPYPRYNRYWRDEHFELTNWPRAPQADVPRAWMESSTLSDALKRWLIEQHQTSLHLDYTDHDEPQW